MNQDAEAVRFHDGDRAPHGKNRRGHVELDGQRYPAWWTGESTAHTTCWVSPTEVVIQHWRYHPQYDEEPVVSRQRHALAEFCLDEAHESVMAEFGEAGTKSILAEARRRAEAFTKREPAAPRWPLRAWTRRDGANNWNYTCTVDDNSVGVHAIKGSDGRTEEYGSHSFEDFQRAEVRRNFDNMFGAGLCAEICSEVSLRSGSSVPPTPAVDKLPAVQQGRQPAGAEPRTESRDWFRNLKKSWRLQLSTPRAMIFRLLRRRQSLAEEFTKWLSFATGALLVLWLIGSLSTEFTEKSILWWHTRVAADMVALNAKVTGHDSRQFSGDGSMGHKNNPSNTRKKWSVTTAILELEYAPDTGQQAIRTRRNVGGGFSGSQAALAYLAAHHPIGSVLAIQIVANRPEHIMLASETPPTFASLLGAGLLTALQLFFSLILIVPFALLVPPAIVWLVTWPFRKRATAPGKP
jgi:hypothetical protein